MAIPVELMPQKEDTSNLQTEDTPHLHTNLPDRLAGDCGCGYKLTVHAGCGNPVVYTATCMCATKPSFTKVQYAIIVRTNVRGQLELNVTQNMCHDNSTIQPL